MTTTPTTGNTPTNARTTTNAMTAVNQHLDAILLGDDDNEPRNLVSLASDAVERVKAELTSCAPINRNALAVMLSDAVWQLHQTNTHIIELAWALGEVQLA
jgi:hypothetical protein